MGQFQLDAYAFVETYAALREQWVQLDKAQKDLADKVGSAGAMSCTVMGGVDYARRSAGEDAGNLLQEVNKAHSDLSKFLFGMHAAFEQYKKDQDDGKMRFEILHPDDGSAKRTHDRGGDELANPWSVIGRGLMPEMGGDTPAQADGGYVLPGRTADTTDVGAS